MTTSMPQEAINLRVNGALLAVARRPALVELDAPLRGVALSDSPVLVRARREEDRAHVAKRLHALGRRSQLPLHICRSADDSKALASSGSTGTWALYDVSAWANEDQRALARLLAKLDEHRLHGNLSHEKMPRIVVIEDADGLARLLPDLIERLAFFDIAIA